MSEAIAGNLPPGATANPLEAETINQKEGGYSNAVRNTLAGYKRSHDFHGVDDAKFVQGLQFAADWLSERQILPKKVTVTHHLARL